MNTKATKKNATKSTVFTKKNIILACVAVLLLVAIGLGLFFTLDYIFVDTPYDGIRMPNHIRVAKYIGVEMKNSDIELDVKKSVDALIEKFSEKPEIKKGELTKGQNVTVSITAKLDGKEVTEASFKSYEIADIGNHEPDEKNKAFIKALEEHILETVTRFDFEGDYINAAPKFTYTYPSDYSVDKVKGKAVVHEILILSVTTTNAPEYNDKFFADNKDEITEFVGVNREFGSCKEYEDYMTEQFKLNNLWNSIIKESAVIKYPEKFIKRYSEDYDNYYIAIMQANGITSWDKLYTQLGTNEAGYNAERLEYAQGIVKEELVLYEIVQAEKIRVSRAQYKEIGLAEAKKQGYESLDAYEDVIGKDIVKRTVLWEVVKDYLVSRANWS